MPSQENTTNPANLLRKSGATLAQNSEKKSTDPTGNRDRDQPPPEENDHGSDQQTQLAAVWHSINEAAATVNQALEIARSALDLIIESKRESEAPMATSASNVIRPPAFQHTASNTTNRTRPHMLSVRIPFERLQERFERELIEQAFREVGAFSISEAAVCLGLKESWLRWILEHRYEDLLKELRSMTWFDRPRVAAPTLR